MKNIQLDFKKLLTLSTCLGAMAIPRFSHAEDTDAKVSIFDEIIVTAQKREQNLQDVSISVTAFSGDVLKELGFTNSIDIVAQTPGLSYGTPNGEGNNASLTLRGVGLNDFNDNNEGPVAVYIDENYVSALMGVTFQMFDLERVEVLRGPQGTLYGRNSTGGLMKFITRKPTEDLNGYVDASYGSYNSVKIEGALGGSIADGIMARISLARNYHDPYVKNLNEGFEDPNNTNNEAIRGQLLLEPSSNVSILLNGHYAKNDARMGSWQNRATGFGTVDGQETFVTLGANDTVTDVDCNADFVVDAGDTRTGTDCFGFRDTDGSPWKGTYDRNGVLLVKNEGFSGTLEWNIDENTTLTAITGYEKFQRKFEEDTESGPFPLINPTFAATVKQFSQEIRLSGETSKMRWLVGGYYFNHDVNGTPQLDLTGLDFLNLDVNYTQKSESVAMFGQVEYDLNEELVLTGGLRYTREDKSLDYVVTDTSGFLTDIIGLPNNIVFDFTESSVGDLTKVSDNYLTWRTGLDWKPTEDSLYYVTWSRGVKSAGFNTGFLDETGFFGSNSTDQVPYVSEKLTSYEVGFKREGLFGGTTRINAAAFYYDYKDFQAFTFQGLTQLIINADATIKGGEVEITSSPVSGLDFMLGVSYLDATAKDIVSPTGEIRDRQMVLAPKWQLNGVVRYEVPIANEASIAAQVDFNFQTRAFFDIQNYDAGQENGYSRWNIRLFYNSPDHRWKFYAQVENLFNEQYKIYTFDFTPTFGFQQEAFGRPRWYSLGVTYNFGE